LTTDKPGRPAGTKRGSRLTATLCVIAGTLLVGLGVVGMFLPVLPPTPFLLLAAICYARGSQRFYHWLLHNRWCGAYIRNYREGRGVTLRHKLVGLFFLWLTLGYAAGFVVQPWWGKALLGAVALGVTIHLLTIKTYHSRD